jgi:hypothetical protein
MSCPEIADDGHGHRRDHDRGGLGFGTTHHFFDVFCHQNRASLLENPSKAPYKFTQMDNTGFFKSRLIEYAPGEQETI